MTQTEKSKINELRADGYGYRRISAMTGLSPNTVKSFLQRSGNEAGTSLVTVGCECKQCHIPIQQTPHKKLKVFCSDLCRMAWWNAHPERVRRKADTEIICEHCGKAFMNNGKAHRRFCSRACYAEYRRKEPSHD